MRLNRTFKNAYSATISLETSGSLAYIRVP